MAIPDMYDTDDLTVSLDNNRPNKELSAVKDGGFTILEINGTKYSLVNPDLIDQLTKTIRSLEEKVRYLDTTIAGLRSVNQQFNRRLRSVDSELMRKIDRE